MKRLAWLLALLAVVGVGAMAQVTPSPSSRQWIWDAANTLAVKNATAAQTIRVYFTTTGPVHYGIVATAAGPRLVATGAAMQLNTAQTTAPTCTSNCGTGSPTIAGTDTAGILTLGTTPASGFVITFNGTWAAAPACIVQPATAGMVVGKLPLTVVTSTTTLTVVTNGTAPATGDKYQYHCVGLQ